MSYAGLIKRLNRRGLFHIHPGLDRIQTILGTLGHPERSFKAIHIAGTNGKGSVAAALDSVFGAAGFCTGLYTSPHLLDVCERIQINRVPISQTLFLRWAQHVLAAERRCKIRLTYFEFQTALAFVAFAEKQVDIAVIETGLGGRWDATNLLPPPEICIITSIGKDHTGWLGKTESAIAFQKAGIIKPGCGGVISGVRGIPARVIQRSARDAEVSLWEIDKDFQGVSRTMQWNAGGQLVDYRGPFGIRALFRFGLLGAHQTDNAAVAFTAMQVLIRRGWRLSSPAIREGLAQFTWPGRLQIVSSAGDPTILLDGAHNPPAIRRLIESIRQSPWHKCRKIWVVGIYRDKDYASIAKRIAACADHIFVCQLPGSRGLPAKELRKVFAPIMDARRLHVVSRPQKALEAAHRFAKAQDLVIASGSLALMGLLLKVFPLPPGEGGRRPGEAPLAKGGLTPALSRWEREKIENHV